MFGKQIKTFYCFRPANVVVSYEHIFRHKKPFYLHYIAHTNNLGTVAVLKHYLSNLSLSDQSLAVIANLLNCFVCLLQKKNKSRYIAYTMN